MMLSSLLTRQRVITNCNARTHELSDYDISELLCLHNSELSNDIRKAIRRFLATQLKNDSHFVNETSLKRLALLFLWGCLR
jgi:TfoX/Sxy family transcriptional regulator of competence genes